MNQDAADAARGARAMSTQHSRIPLAAVVSVILAVPAMAGAGERQDCNHGRRIEYLQQFYGHFAREEARAVADVLPADASWHMIGWRQDIVPFAGVYAGRDELREFFGNYFA